MGDDERDHTARETPPEHDEWHIIWRAVDRANKSWIITGPIHAVVTNWKALLVIGALVLWLNSPKVIAVLAELIPGAKP